MKPFKGFQDTLSQLGKKIKIVFCVKQSINVQNMTVNGMKN